MKHKLLVLSPHPDDETLGAGGTLLKYKAAGHGIFCLNFTDMKPEYGFSAQELARRQGEIAEAGRLLGWDGFYNLQYRPAGLDEVPRRRLIEEIARVVGEVQPDIMILPFQHDVHSDHRVVFEAGLACTKIFRYPFLRRILVMEIISETEFSGSNSGFHPNYFVDISDWFDRKVQVMKAYGSELGDFPFPRSEEHLRALAMHRGVMAGTCYAEGFMLLKWVD